MVSFSRTSQSGFTLVELVAVIVMLGIVAVATTQFIRQGVGIYVDSTRRDNLQQRGRFAIERVARELRNALPGSVRVSGDCIEFAPIAAASSYLNAVADFSITSFEAIAFGDLEEPYTGGRVAVYTIENQDVYDFGRDSVFDIDNVEVNPLSSPKQRTITLDGSHRFRSESPTRRFYIITTPVSFCVRADNLYRHDGYGWLEDPSSDTADLDVGVLLAEGIRTEDDGAVTVFNFSAATLQRAAVVSLDFRFNDDSATDEWLRFSHEVSLRNTP